MFVGEDYCEVHINYNHISYILFCSRGRLFVGEDYWEVFINYYYISYILFCRRGRLLGVVTTVCFIGQRAYTP